MARAKLKLVRQPASPPTPAIFDKGATIPIPRDLSERIATIEATAIRLRSMIAGGGYMMAHKLTAAEALIEGLREI
jgi:hypothetical protein